MRALAVVLLVVILGVWFLVSRLSRRDELEY
jgi:hypothetical protein